MSVSRGRSHRKLDARETLLLGLFLDSFAGDTSTNLYRAFINSSTRKIDLGAQGVFGYLCQDQGDPVVIGLDWRGRIQSHESKVKAVRAVVIAELARIAALPDGSKDLGISMRWCADAGRSDAAS